MESELTRAGLMRPFGNFAAGVLFGRAAIGLGDAPVAVLRPAFQTACPGARKLRATFRARARAVPGKSDRRRDPCASRVG